MKKQRGEDLYIRDKDGRAVAEKPEMYSRPGHHMGDSRSNEYGGSASGYELLPDGSYRLAPCEMNSIHRISDEASAIYALLDHVQRNAMERLAKLATAKREWFSRICVLVYRPEDAARATVNFTKGCLEFKEIEKPTPEEKQLRDRIEEDAAGAGKSSEGVEDGR